MDQLKDFLKQCVKYRFWIAFGISLLLPIIGYFVGVGGINAAQAAREGEINKAKTDIGKYKIPGIVNNQYQPLAAQKNVVLAKDVDESWRKLRALQEPLLRWPEEVEAKFLSWGRKYPSNVDKSEVFRTLTDYTFVYPSFVSKLYKIFKPFNYEDGTGIVVAPDEKALLRPAPYSSDAPPDLSEVWAEQERIWVVTALLNAVARINDSVKATDWDGAIIKQINLIEVGSMADQDQRSMATGVTLVPADVLNPEGAPAPPPPAPTGGGPGAPGALVGAGAGSSAANDDVYYLKNESKQFKTLPIKMSVLVDQTKLSDFLVGLENSPITIQVMEAEVSKPIAPVVKPVKGEAGHNMGMAMGDGAGGGPGVISGPGRNPGRARMGNGAPGVAKGGGGPAAMSPAGPGGGGGNNANSKQGINGRGENKAEIRKNEKKEAATAKPDAKPKADQYYNIVEVTVYGQARFYLAPPPLPASAPSTAGTPPVAAPEAPKVEPVTKAAAAPAEPKKEEDSKAADAPKPEDAPKKADAPAEKADEPKADAPKADAPKADPPKTDVPKTDPPSPKS